MIPIDTLNFLIISVLLVFPGKSILGFTLHIMHINDFHGRVLPTKDGFGDDCSLDDIETERCFGGLARLKYKIDEIRLEYENTILLNVGDLSQGALWYTIFGWEVFIDLFNMMNHTAVAFGTHEFDFGPEGLLPLLDKIDCPALCCNVDDRKVPEFQNMYEKSTIVMIGGQKIGIIGYTTGTGVMAVSNPGLLAFHDEIQSVQIEAQRLHEVENVSIIIAAGSSGLNIDKHIAEIPFVDVVVGGRSHTLLYSGTPPSTEVPNGPYPLLRHKEDGSVALIVHAGFMGKYLGYLSVTFDEKGHPVSWDGNPILMDNTVEEDLEIADVIEKWNTKKQRIVNEKVGETFVFIDGRHTSCRSRECNFGNIVADAFCFLGLKYKVEGQWSYASIALVHGGHVRDSVDERTNKGEITRGAIFEVLPYKNQIYFIEITGETLWQALEFGSIKQHDSLSGNGNFLQVSGLKYTVNLCADYGSRVKDISVLCNECRVPKYSPLKNDSIYRVAVPQFVVQTYKMIANNILSQQSTGLLDSDALIDYLKVRGPMITGTERRITVVGESGCIQQDGNGAHATCENKIFTMTILLLSLLFRFRK